LNRIIYQQNKFESIFQKKDLTQANKADLPKGTPNPIWIVELLKALGAVKTSSEAKRLIESKSVAIDNKPIEDFKAEVKWKSRDTIRVGKHRIYVIN